MRRWIVLAGLLAAGAASQETIDWEKEGRACADLLQEMIRIDTSNPPPEGSGKKNADETALCRRVEKLLAEDGIACEILEPQPGRGNLVARYKGDGSKKPLLLMAHLDVVGVDRGKWVEDPFAAVEKNGVIWGRGALDDKGMAAVVVHVLRLLHRRRPKLSRDVIVMLNADEESSSVCGAKWMVDNHWGGIESELVLNEGGRINLKDGKIVQFAVQSAEKVYNDVWLWVRGESGHSSVPRPENAIYDLAEMLTRLRQYRTPIRVNETVKAYLEGIADLPAYADHRDLLKAAVGGDARAAEALADRNPRFNAVLRTTFVPTIVKGGLRANVLPPDVQVNLNIRLLPGDDLEALLQELARHAGIQDCDIVETAKFEEWKKSQEEARRAGKPAKGAAFVVETRDSEAPASPLDTALMAAVRTVARETAPEAPVVPFLSTGATDSRWFRARGVTCYGLMPLPVTEEEEKTFHDHNERVRASSVRFGVEFTYRVVLESAK